MQSLEGIPLFSRISVSYNLLGSRMLGTRFIPIEVSIVRLGHSNVHAKGIAALHDHHLVTHHTRSMQTRLSVEQHVVSIHHMTVHDIPIV